LCNLNLSTIRRMPQPFVTPNMSLFSGCQMEIEKLLTMRENVCHYCAILDMYSPCIVSYWTWNHDANMNHYCCTTGGSGISS
jgi:hypothetical protein